MKTMTISEGSFSGKRPMRGGPRCFEFLGTVLILLNLRLAPAVWAADDPAITAVPRQLIDATAVKIVAILARKAEPAATPC